VVLEAAWMIDRMLDLGDSEVEDATFVRGPGCAHRPLRPGGREPTIAEADGEGMGK